MRRRFSVILFSLLAVYPCGALLSWLTTAALPTRTAQVLYLISGAAWLAFAASVAAARRTPPGPLPSTRAIWLLAIAARVALLPLPSSDDVYRYIWEGCVILHGENPYLSPPSAAALDSLRAQEEARSLLGGLSPRALSQLVNHPEHAAIYGPAAELTFALIARVSTHPLAFKLVILAADLGTALLLARGWARRGADARLVGVYLLCPLVGWAFAQRGHLDALALLPLAAALQHLRGAEELPRRATGADGIGLRPDESRGGASAAPRGVLYGAALLGLAIAMKWFAVLLVPWLLATAWQRGALRNAAACAVLLLLTFAAPAAPLGSAGAGLVAPLLHFSTEYSVLAGGRAALGAFVPQFWVAPGAFLIVGGAALWAGLRRMSPADAGRCAIGTGLVFSPTMHAWYLTWLIPLLAVRSAWPWWVLVITACVSWEADAIREAGGVWRQPAWVTPAVFGPFFLALALEWLRSRRRQAPLADESCRLPPQAAKRLRG